MVCIIFGCFIGENLVEFYSLKQWIYVLFEVTYPDIADFMSLHMDPLLIVSRDSGLFLDCFVHRFQEGRRISVPQTICISCTFPKSLDALFQRGVRHEKTPQDYITHERHLDNTDRSSALFLPAVTIRNSKGRLTPLVINQVWEEVCAIAKVENKTPHSARHAMGRHIIDKTGNIAAVQRQLGHRNVAYSVQYARVSNKEMLDVLNDRT